MLLSLNLCLIQCNLHVIKTDVLVRSSLNVASLPQRFEVSTEMGSLCDNILLYEDVDDELLLFC